MKLPVLSIYLEAFGKVISQKMVLDLSKKVFVDGPSYSKR